MVSFTRYTVKQFLVKKTFSDEWSDFREYLPDDLKKTSEINLIRKRDGINFVAGIALIKNAVHVQFAPMYYFNPNITEEYIIEVAPKILVEFFGDLEFCRMPDHPAKPICKHFYHML